MDNLFEQMANISKVRAYDIIVKQRDELVIERKELLAALDAVARVFIYSSKKEFEVEDKIRATEMAVAALVKNGITEIGQTFK